MAPPAPYETFGGYPAPQVAIPAPAPVSAMSGFAPVQVVLLHQDAFLYIYFIEASIFFLSLPPGNDCLRGDIYVCLYVFVIECNCLASEIIYGSYIYIFFCYFE